MSHTIRHLLIAAFAVVILFPGLSTASSFTTQGKNGENAPVFTFDAPEKIQDSIRGEKDTYTIVIPTSYYDSIMKGNDPAHIRREQIKLKYSNANLNYNYCLINRSDNSIIDSRFILDNANVHINDNRTFSFEKNPTGYLMLEIPIDKSTAGKGMINLGLATYTHKLLSLPDDNTVTELNMRFVPALLKVDVDSHSGGSNVAKVSVREHNIDYELYVMEGGVPTKLTTFTLDGEVKEYDQIAMTPLGRGKYEAKLTMRPIFKYSEYPVAMLESDYRSPVRTSDDDDKSVTEAVIKHTSSEPSTVFISAPVIEEVQHSEPVIEKPKPVRPKVIPNTIVVTLSTPLPPERQNYYKKWRDGFNPKAPEKLPQDFSLNLRGKHIFKMWSAATISGRWGKRTLLYEIERTQKELVVYEIQTVNNWKRVRVKAFEGPLVPGYRGYDLELGYEPDKGYVLTPTEPL